jgi:copper transport protein
MAVWLGGLVGLFVAVVRPGVPAGELAVALPRFSRAAFLAMTALVLTGVVQSVREVATPEALLTSGYGQLLTAKIVLVVVILGAAGVSRVWVQQRFGVAGRRPARRVTAHAFSATAEAVEEVGPTPGLLTSFRRSVVVELVLAVAVLGVTSVLVGSAPAAASAAQPVDAILQLHTSSGTSGSVEVAVAPARPGANDLHLYLTDASGQPTQPAEITVTVAEPSQSIGPLPVKLLAAGPGHYVSDGFTLPGAGTWTLVVTDRVDEFTAATASTTFPVR